MSEKPTTIIRAPHGEMPFFQMNRATAQDEKLSFAARGVLTYLLSKPDDWRVDVKDLQQGCGRDKVYSLLDELIENRYIAREQVRNDKQQIEGFAYVVYERPLPEKPDTALPDTVSPDTENTDTYIEESIQKTDSTEDSLPNPASAVSADVEISNPEAVQVEPVASFGITSPSESAIENPLQSSAKGSPDAVALDGGSLDTTPLPAKHRWAYMAQRIGVKHLVKDQNYPKQTLCGEGVGSHMASKGPEFAPMYRTCPHCLQVLEAANKPKPKVERKPNPVFDAIALGSFNMPPGTIRGKKMGGRIGGLSNEVIECAIPETVPTPEQLEGLGSRLTAMYAWFKRTYPHLSAPARAETICKYLVESTPSAPPKVEQISFIPHDEWYAETEVK